MLNGSSIEERSKVKRGNQDRGCILGIGKGVKWL